MGLLEKLGWSRRKARPVGNELESAGRSDETSTQRDALVKTGLFVALIALTVAAFPRGEVYEYTVQVGDTWRQPTLVAPFNFPIYKDPAKVDDERRTARESTPPYFEELPAARQTMAANVDTLDRQLDRIMETYAEFRYHRMRSQGAQAEEDSLRYLELRRNALVVLSPEQWRVLTSSFADRLPSRSVESRTPTPSPNAQRLDEELLTQALEIGTQLLSVGVMSIPRDSIPTEEIIIRNEEERVQRSVSKDNVYGLNEAYNYARDQLQDTFPENPDHANIAFAFFRDAFQPSLRYMRGETMEERQRRAQSVSPIRGGVERGEIVVSKGERVTEEVKRKLTSLERVKNERAATKILWKQTSAETLFSVVIYFFFFFYIYLIRKDLWEENRQLLLITMVMAFIIALFGACVRIPWAQLYVVPVALASIVLTIIYNSSLGLFTTLVLAFVGGTMTGLDLEYTLATFFAGALGVFSVRDIKNRGQFFLSAGLVFVGYLLVLTASWLYLGTPSGRFGREVMFAAVGSSFTITSYLLLWVLERTFDITTDLTLLELSDTNNEALKELSLKAPGSFNHSLQVANLAEAAADRIGAHALLTRVGALYHDIGKMQKPEYFVENQRAGSNPHDRLKPRMSALIIASHVKEGLEMAKKKYNLPERVMKFIPMHHGTARIEYFYRKAVGQTEEGDSPVLESEFRYPGPVPNSKETGILMLADSIEAASRSLDEPSHKRLKSLIDLIFRERIEDGQLDGTDLTFQDLSLIKETFLKMLLGIYHVRVKYPDQEDEDTGGEDAAISLAAASGEMHGGVSILWERDVWGTPEQSIGADRLRRVQGIRDPRAPRPEIAEASQYYRLETPSGDGADTSSSTEIPDSPIDDRPSATENGTDDEPTAAESPTNGTERAQDTRSNDPSSADATSEEEASDEKTSDEKTSDGETSGNGSTNAASEPPSDSVSEKPDRPDDAT